MARTRGYLLAVAALMLAPSISAAQADNEKSRTVAGGGISIAGWQGKIDAKEVTAGLTLNDAKLMKMGNDMMVTTGPAVTYWNPSNKASGNYTVKATFKEPAYMNVNTHPHPYGIVIGGNDMGTDTQSYLYCAAYGNGNFIVRGFGPAPFQMNGGRGGADPAVNKAAEKGAPVQQDIAITVTAAKIDCIINGKVVASYDKAAVVAEGKLKSTDGVYGFRFAHNTDGLVSGLTMTKDK
ncbi:MAG: hypothetical protein ABMA00_05255 [Gemmatimonas sp.]